MVRVVVVVVDADAKIAVHSKGSWAEIVEAAPVVEKSGVNTENLGLQGSCRIVDKVD